MLSLFCFKGQSTGAIQWACISVGASSMYMIESLTLLIAIGTQKLNISYFPEDLDECLLNLLIILSIKLMHKVYSIARGYLHFNMHI